MPFTLLHDGNKIYLFQSIKTGPAIAQFQAY